MDFRLRATWEHGWRVEMVPVVLESPTFASSTGPNPEYAGLQLVAKVLAGTYCWGLSSSSKT